MAVSLFDVLFTARAERWSRNRAAGQHRNAARFIARGVRPGRAPGQEAAMSSRTGEPAGAGRVLIVSGSVAPGMMERPASSAIVCSGPG